MGLRGRALSKIFSRGKTPRAAGARTSRRGAAGAGLGAGALAAALFGGGDGGNLQAGANGSAGQGKKSKGGGEANYKPLPEFSRPAAQIKRYSKPTIAIISNQVADMSANLRVTQKILENQFKQSANAYKEMARVTREKNMESGGFGQGSRSGLNMSVAGLLGSANKSNNQNGSDSLLTEALVSAAAGAGGGSLLGGNGNDPDVTPTKKPSLGSRMSSALSGRAADLRNVAGSSGSLIGDLYNRFAQGATNVARKGVIAVRKFGKSISAGISNLSEKIKAWAGPLIDRAYKQLKTGAAQLFERFILKSPGFQKLLEIAGKAGGSLKRNAGWIAGLAFTLYASWDYVKQMGEVIKNRKNLTKAQMTDQLTDIASSMIADVGADVAIIILSMMIGTSVGTMLFPGVGSFVGAVLSFIIGTGIAMAMDFILYLADGKSKAKANFTPLIRKLVDVIYGAVETVNNISGGGLDRLAATNASVRPTQSNPTNGTAAAGRTNMTNNQQSSSTAQETIVNAASQAGVDPSALLALANGDLNKDISLMTGKELFALTNDQWSQISRKYTSQYPQLSAGINDPKAASIASALLLKDSKNFLLANRLPVNANTLQSTWLFGADSTKKLLESDANEIASKILPSAAAAKPEYFKDTAGKERTVSDMLSTIYQTTSRGKSMTSGAGIVPIARPLAAATTPGDDRSYATPESQQQLDRALSGISSSRPALTSGGRDVIAEINQSRAAETGASAVQMPSPSATTITPSSGATDMSDNSDPPHTGVPVVSAENNEAIPPEVAPSPVTPDVATPVPPTPQQMLGEKLNGMMRTIESILNPRRTMSNPPAPPTIRTPAIMPAGSAGHSGTGLVPDPHFHDLETIIPFIYVQNRNSRM